MKKAKHLLSVVMVLTMFAFFFLIGCSSGTKTSLTTPVVAANTPSTSAETTSAIEQTSSTPTDSSAIYDPDTVVFAVYRWENGQLHWDLLNNRMETLQQDIKVLINGNFIDDKFSLGFMSEEGLFFGANSEPIWNFANSGSKIYNRDGTLISSGANYLKRYMDLTPGVVMNGNERFFHYSPNSSSRLSWQLCAFNGSIILESTENIRIFPYIRTFDGTGLGNGSEDCRWNYMPSGDPDVIIFSEQVAGGAYRYGYLKLITENNSGNYSYDKIIPAKYTYVENFYDGYAYVEENGIGSIIDQSGNTITQLDGIYKRIPYSNLLE